MDTLLQRSAMFEQAILACFPPAALAGGSANRQGELVASACVLSAEHARALRAAFAHAAPNAGAALLRLQYQALLRAVWLMFGAIPPQLDLLDRTQDFEGEQAAGHLPSDSAMLDAVVAQAPLGMSAPLAEFNQTSRQALNAFVQRRGVPPLHGAQQGAATETAATLVHFSNALMHFAYRLLASFSGSEQRMDRVTDLYLAFGDCVPMPLAPGGAPAR